MTKNQILDEIRRTAKANDGKPIGMQRFATLTGIRKADWIGKYWLRWGDALAEAGFERNTFSSAVPEADLLASLASLTGELGHFPIDAELKRAARSSAEFPSHSTFRRLGNKRERLGKLATYSREHGLNDVASICESALTALPRERAKPVHVPASEFGYVYMIKSGRFYKIGRTNAPGRRERELAIQLPEKVKIVHEIKTDDPAGIEAYWHRRFQDRRKNGEWFELSAQDVSAFRRRKGFM